MHNSHAVAIWIRAELRRSPVAMAFADALETFAARDAALTEEQRKVEREELYRQWRALTDAERAKIEDIESDMGLW